MQADPLSNPSPLPPQSVQQPNPSENQFFQELNLQAVRTRTIELQNTISRIQAAFYNQPNLRWTDVLGQFALVNASIFQLMEDLKSILRHFAVHPAQVNAENSNILPIMLSSKLLPEMEEEENSFKQIVMAELSSLPLNVQMERLQRGIDAVKMACDRADKIISDERRAQGIGSRQGPYQSSQMDKTKMVKMEELERKLRNAIMDGEGLRLHPSQLQKPSVMLPRYLIKPGGMISNVVPSPVTSIASPSADTNAAAVVTPQPATADTPHSRNVIGQATTPGHPESPAIHKAFSPQNPPLMAHQRTPSMTAIPSPSLTPRPPPSPASPALQALSASNPISVQQGFSPNSMSAIHNVNSNPNLLSQPLKLSTLNPLRMNVSSPQQQMLQANIQTQQQMYSPQNANSIPQQQAHGILQKPYLQQSMSPLQPQQTMQQQPIMQQQMQQSMQQQHQQQQQQQLPQQTLQQQPVQQTIQQPMQHPYLPQIQQQIPQSQQTIQKQSPLLQQQQQQQQLLHHQQQQQRAMQQQQIQQQQSVQQQPNVQQATALLQQQRQRVAMQQMQQGMQSQNMQQQQQQQQIQQQQMMFRRLQQTQQQQQQQPQNRQLKR